MKHSFYLILCFTLFSCSVSKKTKGMHPYTGDHIACDNFIAFKLAEDSKGYVSVAFSISEIELQTTQAYAIGKSEVLAVRRKMYDGKIDAMLCNDVMQDRPELLIDEVATSGIVELRLDKENLEKARSENPYRITVILKDVVFEGVSIDYLHLPNIYVGWLPG